MFGEKLEVEFWKHPLTIELPSPCLDYYSSQRRDNTFLCSRVANWICHSEGVMLCNDGWSWGVGKNRGRKQADEKRKQGDHSGWKAPQRSRALQQLILIWPYRGIPPSGVSRRRDQNTAITLDCPPWRRSWWPELAPCSRRRPVGKLAPGCVVIVSTEGDNVQWYYLAVQRVSA